MANNDSGSSKNLVRPNLMGHQAPKVFSLNVSFAKRSNFRDNTFPMDPLKTRQGGIMKSATSQAVMDARKSAVPTVDRGL